MKQVVQSISGGPVRVVDVPRPAIGPTEVLVRTLASVISPGTERAVTSLAQSSLLAKARARPDLVRQVIRKAKTEGLAQTARAVRGRLEEDLPLGYSAAGIAVAVGEAVADVTPGQLVATGGAGAANHAEFQAVPGLLCSRVPEEVAPEDAAFTTIASIALHGLRLAEVGPGSRIAVIGLGLVGQLTTRIALASGCEVAGIDISENPIQIAKAAGVSSYQEEGDTTTKAIVDWARGRGCDAVIISAGGKDSKAIMRSPELCRDRANVVVVGDVGLDIERRPFYEKELTVRFARSYGPGRYERPYEEWGVDYPIGHVRWTEGRNFEAVLDLMGRGALSTKDLVTHRFAIDDAASAYDLIEKRSEPYLGIALTYPTAQPEAEEPIRLTSPKRSTAPAVGLIGAGSFATSVLVPAMKEAGFDRFASIASASGLSAKRLGERAGFERAVAGADAVIEDPDVDVVVVATPHDSHASLTEKALRAGKHVFCEKPLALTMDELERVRAALEESDGVLFVGFNRRWSRPIQLVNDHFKSRTEPLVITYRVNAGRLPESHWYNDRRQGGRLIGEVSHFIDTCASIVGTSAVDVSAFGSGTKELLLSDDFVVSLRYDDGSLATISYASGGNPRYPKERIEVIGEGSIVIVDDFKSVDVDGSVEAIKPQDKGHVAEMRAFIEMLSSGQRDLSAIETSEFTLEAASTLRSSNG